MSGLGCSSRGGSHCGAHGVQPSSLVGIDPSDAQLDFARKHPLLESVSFVNADAMALPFPETTFDLVVMPLVIVFVPEPAKGVAEMARVVAPGGTVAAYAMGHGGWGVPLSARQRNPCNHRPAHTQAPQSRGLPPCGVERPLDHPPRRSERWLVT